MEKVKRKRKLHDPEDMDTIAEIYKKLLSLVTRLGNAKGRQDCTLSTLKGMYNFME